MILKDNNIKAVHKWRQAIVSTNFSASDVGSMKDCPPFWSHASLGRHLRMSPCYLFVQFSVKFPSFFITISNRFLQNLQISQRCCCFLFPKILCFSSSFSRARKCFAIFDEAVWLLIESPCRSFLCSQVHKCFLVCFIAETLQRFIFLLFPSACEFFNKKLFSFHSQIYLGAKER